MYALTCRYKLYVYLQGRAKTVPKIVATAGRQAAHIHICPLFRKELRSALRDPLDNRSVGFVLLVN